VLSRLEVTEWSRGCIYDFLGPTAVDVEWLALDSVHEVVHHLLDIDEVIARVK
jgi:hypothetical protein